MFYCLEAEPLSRSVSPPLLHRAGKWSPLFWLQCWFPSKLVWHSPTLCHLCLPSAGLEGICQCTRQATSFLALQICPFTPLLSATSLNSSLETELTLPASWSENNRELTRVNFQSPWWERNFTVPSSTEQLGRQKWGAQRVSPHISQLLRTKWGDILFWSQAWPWWRGKKNQRNPILCHICLQRRHVYPSTREVHSMTW